MENKVRLTVLGFSFNQTQSGAYGLVLSEEEGKRRLMVVVGAPEAQSIAFKLQNVTPPRPLTHDLFKSLLDSFYINLEEVIINDFIEGVFHSVLIFKQGDHTVQMDSRTSDAVALAIRTGAPIYTTEKIMQELAVVIDESSLEEIPENSAEPIEKANDYSLFKTDKLQDMLHDAIKDENYELASILRDAIQKKKGSN